MLKFRASEPMSSNPKFDVDLRVNFKNESLQFSTNQANLFKVALGSYVYFQNHRLRFGGKLFYFPILYLFSPISGSMKLDGTVFMNENHVIRKLFFYKSIAFDPILPSSVHGVCVQRRTLCARVCASQYSIQLLLKMSSIARN